MWLALLLAACGPKDAVLEPDKLTLDFIIIDDGNDQLRRVDQLHGNNWTIDMPPGALDLQHWNEEEVLVSHAGGAVRVDVQSGDVTWEVDGFGVNITSATPQPNGGVLLGGAFTGYIQTFSIDSSGNDNGGGTTIPNIKLANIIREIPGDHLLVTGGDPWYMTEIGGFSGTVWSTSLPARGWGAARTDTGTYLVSATNAVQLLELTRTGASVATFSGAGQDEDLGLRYFAGFDRRDGMTVVANWKALDASPGVHLAGYHGSAELAWSWDDASVASVPGVAILDVHYPE